MFKKITVCAIVFFGLFIMGWAANEQQKREFIEWDEFQDIELVPISTETNLNENKKVYKKYKSREYVRISTAS
ncbi:MAG TPA: hypothetical protein VNM69_15095 [Bacillus sp. (in: firmicutes)]|uniref:hypothetical protein n=1 Tax=Bacillus litorisediminis TaxID=2922713 RepID=UPI001FABD3DE|nr:hypothetical protein [Bacillus litorisediminis]HWO77200.1 hypothetical protein [Bacillus sp. (in: firmicutes)]